MTVIRPARLEDLAAIVVIQNVGLHDTTDEWTEVDHTIAEWTGTLQRKRSAGQPVLVAEQDGEVVGWTTYGDFRDSARWEGYTVSVELTIHVRQDYRGRGIGRSLMEALAEHAVQAGKTVLVAGIDSTNQESLAFHRRLGFVETARMPGVGRKLNRRLDLVLMQRSLEVEPSNGQRGAARGDPGGEGVDPRTDRSVLTSVQYASGANLASRASIYRYQRPAFDFTEWVLEQYRWQGTERAMDLGCGYGTYLPGLGGRAQAVVGIDLSLGMLAEAAEKGAPLVCGDAQELPFPDASFDVAIAPHMLYHLPDPGAGIAELHRVVRSGGSVLAVTNGAEDKPQLMVLLHQAAGRPMGTYLKTDSRFLLDDARTLLSLVFEHVRVVEVRTELSVPEAAPIVGFLNSMRSAAEPALGVDWPEFLARAAAIVQATITAQGSFRITTHAGVVIAE